MNIFRKKISLIIPLLFILFFNIYPAQAQMISLTDTISSDCMATGACTICDLMTVAVNIAKIILGVTGSIALLLFIYSGLRFILAQGNSEQVDSAKKMLTATIIGIFIILSAWQATRITILVLVGSKTNESSTLLQSAFNPTSWPSCKTGEQTDDFVGPPPPLEKPTQE